MEHYDIDISFYPNMQHDDIKYKLWIWEKGIFSIMSILKQMIPFFIILGISSLLFGFFMAFIYTVCFLIMPMVVHAVVTDLFIRLFLSQHVNLNYFSPQIILELLLMDAHDIRHIIMKSNTTIIYAPTEEENNIYFQSVSIMSNILSTGNFGTVTTALRSSPTTVLDSVLRLVFLKSLQNQSNVPPVSGATKEGSIELVYILRYLCIYLGSLGTALHQLHKEKPLPPGENITSKTYSQVLNIPCLSTCILAYINYSITILHTVLRAEPRHTRMSILVPIFFKALFDLHKGLLEHARHVDERKNIVTLNTIEDVVMDFINEVHNHDTLKMQPEVKLWVADIRIRYEKKNI